VGFVFRHIRWRLAPSRRDHSLICGMSQVLMPQHDILLNTITHGSECRACFFVMLLCVIPNPLRPRHHQGHHAQ
jgi:hypothetical protein